MSRSRFLFVDAHLSTRYLFNKREPKCGRWTIKNRTILLDQQFVLTTYVKCEILWFVVEEFVCTWFNEFQLFLTMNITWIYLLWRFEFLVQLNYSFEKLCPMDSILWYHSISTLGFHFCLRTWPLEMFWRNWISQDVMKYLHSNTMRTSFHTAV